MFISIIRSDHTSIYECNHVRFEPQVDDDHVFVSIEGKQNLNFHLIKQDTKIYIMNEEGKTIDSYDWTCKPDKSRD